MPSDLKICDLPAALERLGGNQDLLREAVQFFHDDVPKLVERMKNAAAQENGAELSRAAHSLRGLVVNFSAEATESAAREVEQMGQSGNLSRATKAVRRVEKEIARLTKELG